MSVEDVVRFASAASQLSPLGIAIFVLLAVFIALWRRWLVIGNFYADLEVRLAKTEQQRDDALGMAAKLTDILESGRRGSYRGR